MRGNSAKVSSTYFYTYQVERGGGGADGEGRLCMWNKWNRRARHFNLT